MVKTSLQTVNPDSREAEKISEVARITGLTSIMDKRHELLKQTAKLSGAF
ncbi:MAG: hypothetical protein OEW15_10070 [Nitrospirota bacterium]|nr:hypothetical protein [Nitrospirota bacterium]